MSGDARIIDDFGETGYGGAAGVCSSVINLISKKEIKSGEVITALSVGAGLNLGFLNLEVV